MSSFSKIFRISNCFLLILIVLSSLQCKNELQDEDLFVIYTTGTVFDSDGVYGFINIEGEIVIEPKYELAYRFTKGLAWVKLRGKYGCIDKNGKMVIEPFKCDQSPGYFSEGLSAVSVDGKWGFIDKSGDMVIPAKYRSANSFSEGFAKVMLDDKWSLIDKTAKTHFENRKFIGNIFSEGLIAIKLDDKWGFMDKSGSVVIETKYKLAWPYSFSNGLAPIWLDDGEANYINKRGNIVLKQNILVGDGTPPIFSEGFAAIQFSNHKTGIIDTTGKIVIEPPIVFPNSSTSFNRGSFSDSLAVIRTRTDLWYIREGYIDKSGKVVIMPKYEFASNFYNGLAWVRINRKEAVINKAGKYVWPPDFDDSERVLDRSKPKSVAELYVEALVNDNFELFLGISANSKDIEYITKKLGKNSEIVKEAKKNYQDLRMQLKRAHHQLNRWYGEFKGESYAYVPSDDYHIEERDIEQEEWGVEYEFYIILDDGFRSNTLRIFLVKDSQNEWKCFKDNSHY